MPMSRAGSNGWLGEPMRTSPESCGCRPASTFSKVDLPQPDGPTSATSSPGITSKVASEIARCSLRPVRYVLLTPDKRMNGSIVAVVIIRAPLALRAVPPGGSMSAWGGSARS